MSEFFRTHAPVEFTAKTLRQLAALVHDAEDTGDDVLLLQCHDELKRREATIPQAMTVFMEVYRELWHERANKKQ